MRKNFDCEITKNILIKALNIKKYIYFIFLSQKIIIVV